MNTENLKQAQFKNAQNIRDAVDKGKQVYVGNKAYKVEKSNGDYFIKCTLNNHKIGLTWEDGTTLNDKIEKFYTEE